MESFTQYIKQNIDNYTNPKFTATQAYSDYKDFYKGDDKLCLYNQKDFYDKLNEFCIVKQKRLPNSKIYRKLYLLKSDLYETLLDNTAESTDSVVTDNIYSESIDSSDYESEIEMIDPISQPIVSSLNSEKHTDHLALCMFEEIFGITYNTGFYNIFKPRQPDGWLDFGNSLLIVENKKDKTKLEQAKVQIKEYVEIAKSRKDYDVIICLICTGTSKSSFEYNFYDEFINPIHKQIAIFAIKGMFDAKYKEIIEKIIKDIKPLIG